MLERTHTTPRPSSVPHCGWLESEQRSRPLPAGKFRCNTLACVEEYGKQEKNENERRMQCTNFGDKSVDKSHASLQNPLGTHQLPHCLILGH